MTYNVSSGTLNTTIPYPDHVLLQFRHWQRFAQSSCSVEFSDGFRCDVCLEDKTEAIGPVPCWTVYCSCTLWYAHTYTSTVSLHSIIVCLFVLGGLVLMSLQSMTHTPLSWFAVQPHAVQQIRIWWGQTLICCRENQLLGQTMNFYSMFFATASTLCFFLVFPSFWPMPSVFFRMQSLSLWLTSETMHSSCLLTIQFYCRQFAYLCTESRSCSLRSRVR